MAIGHTMQSRRYQFKFNGVADVAGANYLAGRAEIIVSRNGTEIKRMYPEKRNYTATGNVMTETAIDTGLFRDLYVSLGEPVSGGAWSVRVYYKPFVDWIWGGAVLMAIGGGLALSDRRYAVAAGQEREAQPVNKAQALPASVAASVQTGSE